MDPDLDPAVSVCMTAYNARGFIDQAIQSILDQRGPFHLKLIIGDDCSMDGTSDICADYARRFPNRVIHRRNSANLGLRHNFFQVLNSCLSSRYIAFCEGDDYWTCSSKLAEQIDFLARNPDVIAHAHNTRIYYQHDGSSKLMGATSVGALELRAIFEKWPFHMGSLLTRSRDLAGLASMPFPPISTSCDTLLNLWLGLRGPIHYNGRLEYAVYRKHGGGLSDHTALARTQLDYLTILRFLRSVSPIPYRFWRDNMLLRLENYIYYCGSRQEYRPKVEILRNYLDYCWLSLRALRWRPYTHLAFLSFGHFVRFWSRFHTDKNPVPPTNNL